MRRVFSFSLGFFLLLLFAPHPKITSFFCTDEGKKEKKIISGVVHFFSFFTSFRVQPPILLKESHSQCWVFCLRCRLLNCTASIWNGIGSICTMCISILFIPITWHFERMLFIYVEMAICSWPRY